MLTSMACLSCLLIRDATPDLTLKNFFEALNGHNWKGVFSRIEGAKVDQVVPQFDKLTSTGGPIPKFTIKVTSLTVKGEFANGIVSVGIQAPNESKAVYQDDEVHIHNVKGDWKISDGKTANSLFSQLGEIGRNPGHLAQARDASNRTIILSNLKQITLGILMYANDSDDKISFDQSTMKAKLQPYLKSDKLWKDSSNKLLDIRVNPALIGKSFTSVTEPALCVLLSIGPKEKLQYFEDVTPIAFADGHVKLLKKEDVAKLKWK